MPWRYVRGIDSGGWERMDAVAVVRVAGAPHIPENPNDPRRDWPVTVVSTYDGAPSPVRLRVRGSWGVPEGPFEHPGAYVVIAAMPKDGKDAPLFGDSDLSGLDSAPDGHARVYWALPFSGTPPRSGGTKEEWFGRALLAALEGDPAVYKQGLEEFFESTEPEVLGLSEEAVPPDLFQWLFAGRIPNAFALGLADWARRHGPAERLFAACALRNLQVSGVMPFEHQARWDFAALDRDPPEGILYSTTDEIAETYELDLSPELRARMLGRWPTPEQWLSRLLSLKNPKARMFLLRSGLEGRLSHDQNRRLAALLDSPDPEMRFILCRHFWLSQPPLDRSLEPKRRSEGLHNSLPDDYPRLDEHVARWRAFYR